MRAALVQMQSSDDPVANLADLLPWIAEAAGSGAQLVVTPEVSNCVSMSRAQQRAVLSHERDDTMLAALRLAAEEHRIWLLIGSVALKTDDPDGRFANRSFLVSPTGKIAARYDKIHMFDVQLSDRESYVESSGYRPGDRAVIAETSIARIGLTICYDLRFPKLFRDLAQAGAQIITVPSAFSAGTGAAHWEVLLRARAIESGAFILAPAQSGTHRAVVGASRRTWGHSLVVSPWGEVLADAGDKTGVTMVDLNLQDVDAARAAIPVLTQDRCFEAP